MLKRKALIDVCSWVTAKHMVKYKLREKRDFGMGRVIFIMTEICTFKKAFLEAFLIYRV